MELLEYKITEWITINNMNRSEKRNALNSELRYALTNAFKTVIDNADVKIIVLKDNREVFSAGADRNCLKPLKK
jgi:enoyl-CoA hydratase/carnithine racemase